MDVDLSWNGSTPPILRCHVGGPELCDRNICQGKWPGFLQSASAAYTSLITGYLDPPWPIYAKRFTYIYSLNDFLSIYF